MCLLRLAGIDPTLLDCIVTFLEKFVDACKDLESEKTPTLHLAVPWLYKLKLHCSSPSECQAIGEIKRRAADLLQNKFRLQPVHYVAAVLNPKMKSLKMMDLSEQKEEVYKSLRDMVAADLSEAGRPTSDVHSSGGSSSDAVAMEERSPVSKKPRLFEDFEDDDTTQAVPTDEVTQYLAMRVPRDSTVSVLEWWKGHESELPKLAQVARRVLSIPASSAASERAFSAAGLTISQRRTALDADTVNNILFIHSNK